MGDLINLLYVGDVKSRCISQIAVLYFQLPPRNFSLIKPWYYKLTCWELTDCALVSTQLSTLSFLCSFCQQLKEVSQTVPTFSCSIQSFLLFRITHLYLNYHCLVQGPLPLCFAVAVISESWFLPASSPLVCPLHFTLFPKRVFWTFCHVIFLLAVPSG